MIARIAGRLGRTAAQVVLRWHVENGFVAIPKSATPSRISENLDVFGFSLTEDDHTAIAGSTGRTGGSGRIRRRCSNSAESIGTRGRHRRSGRCFKRPWA